MVNVFLSKFVYKQKLSVSGAHEEEISSGSEVFCFFLTFSLNLEINSKSFVKVSLKMSIICCFYGDF